MTDRFRVLIRVRYAECDAQNVVFNARYGDYVDLAVTEYYRELFGSYNEMLKQGIDAQVVSMKTDWMSPARFDDILSISVEPVRFGNSSYSFRLEFKDHQSGREVAVSEITYVAVTPGSHKKMTLPDHFREALRRPSSTVVDFSGG